jgi:hypothetical protein
VIITAPAKLGRALVQGEQAHTHMAHRRQADPVVAYLEMEPIGEG